MRQRVNQEKRGLYKAGHPVVVVTPTLDLPVENRTAARSCH